MWVWGGGQVVDACRVSWCRTPKFACVVVQVSDSLFTFSIVGGGGVSCLVEETFGVVVPIESFLM